MNTVPASSMQASRAALWTLQAASDDLGIETACAVFLDASGAILGACVTGVGERNHVHISREILMDQAQHFNARFIAISHNHPSGNLKASIGDIESDRVIRELAESAGMTVIENLIFSTAPANSGEWYSFRLCVWPGERKRQPRPKKPSPTTEAA